MSLKVETLRHKHVQYVHTFNSNFKFMEETKNLETQPGGDDVAPTDGGETGNEGNQESLRDKMNKDLNKDFKSDEDVVNSYNEAQKAIGDKSNEITALKKQLEEAGKGNPLSEDVAKLTNRLNQAEFYKDNPDYEQFKDVLGSNPDEAIKNESLKKTLDAALAHNKSEGEKSVLHSNPRMGQVKDKMGEARENIANSNKALREGDAVTSHKLAESATKSAVNAVIDAYEL